MHLFRSQTFDATADLVVPPIVGGTLVIIWAATPAFLVAPHFGLLTVQNFWAGTLTQIVVPDQTPLANLTFLALTLARFLVEKLVVRTQQRLRADTLAESAAPEKWLGAELYERADAITLFLIDDLAFQATYGGDVADTLAAVFVPNPGREAFFDRLTDTLFEPDVPHLAWRTGFWGRVDFALALNVVPVAVDAAVLGGAIRGEVAQYFWVWPTITGFLIEGCLTNAIFGIQIADTLASVWVPCVGLLTRLNFRTDYGAELSQSQR